MVTVSERSGAFKNAPNALFLGRGFNFPIALEGALKLKEISYIHAEGYPAAEMKHGPIALIDENMPVFFVATKDAHYDKVVSNIQEVKARGARVIVIAEEGAHVEGAEHVIRIPVVPALFQPVLATVPFQVFAYEMAVVRGNEPSALAAILRSVLWRWLDFSPVRSARRAPSS